MVFESKVETTIIPTESGHQVPGSKLPEVPGAQSGTSRVGLVAVGSLVFVFACFIVFSFLRSRTWCPHTWSRERRRSHADIPDHLQEETDVQVVYLADADIPDIPTVSSKKSAALSKVDCKVFNIVGTTSEETSTDVGYASASPASGLGNSGGGVFESKGGGALGSMSAGGTGGEFTAHIEVDLEMRARTVRFANIPDPVVRQASDQRIEVSKPSTSVKFQRSVSLEDAFNVKHPDSGYRRLALPDGIRIYAQQNLAFDDSDDVITPGSHDDKGMGGNGEEPVVLETAGQGSET